MTEATEIMLRNVPEIFLSDIKEFHTVLTVEQVRVLRAKLFLNAALHEQWQAVCSAWENVPAADFNFMGDLDCYTQNNEITLPEALAIVDALPQFQEPPTEEEAE